jgi:NAD(P)-dependent dehydrogenase (short-subunit alcohol dehydrogenase family)
MTNIEGKVVVITGASGGRGKEIRPGDVVWFAPNEKHWNGAAPKIDGAALEAVTAEGEHEATGAQLNGDAWICGRTFPLSSKPWSSIKAMRFGFAARTHR